MTELAFTFTPEKLSTLCEERIAFDLRETIASYNSHHGVLELKKSLHFLTNTLMDNILDTYIRDGLQISDELVYMLKDCSRVRVSRIDLSNSDVSDDGLSYLSEHSIESLDIHNCSNITGTSSSHIGKMAPTLQVLILGSASRYLFTPASSASEGSLPEAFEKLANADTLRVLRLHVNAISNVTLAEQFLSRLTNLRHLDLSDSFTIFNTKSDMEFLTCLKQLEHLSSLTLHNVIAYGTDMHHYLLPLAQLKSLRHLDVSTVGSQRHVQMPSKDSQRNALQRLLSELPHLTSLDLSCTHLACFSPDVTRDTPIPALEGRHFQFLGLLRCDDRPSERENLPASRVSGDSDIKQILESLRAYRHRRLYLIWSLQSLHDLLKLKSVELNYYPELVSIIAELLRMHQHDLGLLLIASATMCYLIYPESRQHPDVKAHQYISARILRKTVRVLHNTLLQGLENSNRFIYRSLSETLLEIIRSPDLEDDEFLVRLALAFLNKMLRGDDSGKKLLGELAVIEVLCNLIRAKLRNDSPDNQLNLSWTALWNVTDETSDNCRQFIDCGGIDLFLDCYYTFCLSARESERDLREELLRNMLGSLGNVAEVQALRLRLCQPALLSLLWEVLESAEKGMEVNYHSAGIICHILFDGNDTQAIWSKCSTSSSSQEGGDETGERLRRIHEVDEPPRHMMDSSSEGSDSEGLENLDVKSTPAVDLEEESRARSQIRASLVEAMARWDLDSERCINYRSFAPILKLLKCEHTVEVRQWACWVLCSLTTIQPTRYCHLLKNEGGMAALENLISNSAQQTGEVVSLARIALVNCQNELARC
ncbi:protein zer-1 homolog isoform X2 [Watersipora subatra]|uniref:protein zer-1 homolog isoform X2 n=1 Tax=Watersipora subatra TaxID=2589382 RepID=UPI00355AF9BD